MSFGRTSDKYQCLLSHMPQRSLNPWSSTSPVKASPASTFSRDLFQPHISAVCAVRTGSRTPILDDMTTCSL